MPRTKRARLSSKGQVVIPQEIREQLGLVEGDELEFYVLDARLLVAEAVKPSPLEEALQRIQAEVRERGITREDLEKALAEVKQEVYRERYGEKKGRSAVS